MNQDETHQASKRQPWVKRNGDFVAIAIMSGFITFFLYFCYASTDLPRSARPAKPFNFGFDQGMDCEPVGLGEPVCVRRRY